MAKGFTRGKKVVKQFGCIAVLLGCWHLAMADSERDAGHIEAFVNAALGGTFSDDPHNPSITVSIPPGALSDDAHLRVRRTYRARGGFTTTQQPASAAFSVSLRTSDGSDGAHRRRSSTGRLTLSQPMRLEIAAHSAPVHPQIGEIAAWDARAWTRMQANFYRASSNSVVTQTDAVRGVYRVVHRTLQARSGPDVERGRVAFFDDTWGNEIYWGNRFRLHELMNDIAPAVALSLGAQVDINKVPAPVAEVLLGEDYAAKQAALQDPQLTRTLIKAGAVLGIRGFYEDPENPERMTSLGVTCALCHVIVDKTAFQIDPPPAEPVPLAVGGLRIGYPNAELAIGTILGASPLVSEDPVGQNQASYLSWAPGNFDVRSLPDNPLDDGVVNASQFPQIWNYLDLAEQNYAIGWIGQMQLRADNNSLASGSEFGIDLVLGINGAWGTENAAIKNFELGNPLQSWVIEAIQLAEINEPGNVMERGKLLDVKAYMESLLSPAPGEFDEALALEGWALFYGKANCVSCHATAEGTGREGEYFTHIVERPPQGILSSGIKVPGLRGLAFTAPYYHDGSAATLEDVIQRYASPDIPEVPSSLTTHERSALVEYLKSL